MQQAQLHNVYVCMSPYKVNTVLVHSFKTLSVLNGQFQHLLQLVVAGVGREVDPVEAGGGGGGRGGGRGGEGRGGEGGRENAK